MKKANNREKPPISNKLRIIAGEWRGRNIEFNDSDGLRPTGDRIRETLFNWLMPSLRGARCLDLFAGSGILGFEALSRGAAYSVAIDKDKSVCEFIRAQAALLSCSSIDVIHASAMNWLTHAEPCQYTGNEPIANTKHTALSGFDIVFMDPPFHKQWLRPHYEKLCESGLLNPNALLYIEREKRSAFEPEKDWHCLKSKTTGQVTFELYTRADE